MTLTQTPFEMTVHGLRLRGSCHVPAGAGPFPAALLFHGFGANRMEHAGAFVALARQLVRAGIAAIAYDRAGHGESDGDFFDTCVSRDVDHAQEVVRAVRRLPFVDTGSLHFVGMSLGAIVAAVTAAESAVPVTSLTLWSSAGVFVDEIRSGTLQGRSLSTLETLGYFDFMGQRLGPAMRDDACRFDLYGRVSPYLQPVLILHGDADFVPLRYAERLRDAYGGRATLQVVPGADHGWSQVPHRDLVMARTLEFIASNARRAP